MTKANKVLNDFFKIAEYDGDINGSTSVLTDLAKKEYKETSENARHGLPEKSATSYPRGKTTVCRGNECNKPSTGGGLFCDNCSARSQAKDPSFSLKPPSGGRTPEYVDKFTQNQIWNADPRNKKASQVLKDYFK